MIKLAFIQLLKLKLLLCFVHGIVISTKGNFRSSLFETESGKCISDELIYKAITRTDSKQCVLYCLSDEECTASSFNKNSGECYLTHSDAKSQLSKTMSIDVCVMYKKIMDKDSFLQNETLLLRGTAHNGQPVMEAFKHTFPTNSSYVPEMSCRSFETTNCTQHYRSPFLDHWNRHEFVINKIHVRMFKAGKQVAYLTFGGFPNRKPGKHDWFKTEFLQDSSWKTINDGIRAGSLDQLIQLRSQNFAVTEVNSLGIWMMVCEKSSCGSITFNNNIPTFAYAVTEQFGMKLQDFDQADVFVVSYT